MFSSSNVFFDIEKMLFNYHHPLMYHRDAKPKQRCLRISYSMCVLKLFSAESDVQNKLTYISMCTAKVFNNNGIMFNVLSKSKFLDVLKMLWCT